MKSILWNSIAASCVLLLPSWGQRVTVPLDGNWQIEDSASATALPEVFHHQAPVPGLANLALPVFSDVDRFVSRELARHPITRPKDLPPGASEAPVGILLQARNYFW
jgi:hypothetical protein